MPACVSDLQKCVVTFVITHLLAQGCNFLLNANHIHGLGVANDWGDQSLLGSNSDGDVDVVAVDNGVSRAWTLNSGIDGWKVLHSEDGSARKGRHETKLDTSLLQYLLLVHLPELHKC